MFITFDPKKAINETCGTENNLKLQNPAPLEKIEKNNSGARLNPCPTLHPIRALFLITPEARAANPDINGTVNLSISQFNSCIYNSAITSSAAMELAGIQDFNFVTTSIPKDDVNRLAGDQGAQVLRNNFQADVVVIFTHANYGNLYGIVAAVGPSDANAYAIVQVTRATPYRVSAHELGHLFGAKHQNDNNTPSWAKAYSKTNWLNQTLWCTIMYSNASTETKLNFSNPNVRINGSASGTSTNNNAQRLTETFATVRAFRPEPPYPFGLYVEGPDEVLAPGFRTYEAVYSCGSPPYSFSWAYSIDGFNYTTVSSTTDTYNHPFYYQGIEPYWLNVRVTASDGLGATVTTFKRTYVNVPGYGGYITNLTLYPNPTDQFTTVDYTLEEDGPVSVQLINHLGGTVKESAFPSQSPGQNSITLDV